MLYRVLCDPTLPSAYTPQQIDDMELFQIAALLGRGTHVESVGQSDDGERSKPAPDAVDHILPDDPEIIEALKAQGGPILAARGRSTRR